MNKEKNKNKLEVLQYVVTTMQTLNFQETTAVDIVPAIEERKRRNSRKNTNTKTNSLEKGEGTSIEPLLGKDLDFSENEESLVTNKNTALKAVRHANAGFATNKDIMQMNVQTRKRKTSKKRIKFLNKY